MATTVRFHWRPAFTWGWLDVRMHGIEAWSLVFVSFFRRR